MTEEKKPTGVCPACKAVREAIYVGTASGRPHFECGCGAKWIGKNPAASALGRLGAQALNNSLSAKERQTSGKNAADARWRKKKLAENVQPGKAK